MVLNPQKSMAHWSSHCRTNRRPVSSLVVVLLLLLQCTHPCHGLFFELFAGECAGSDLRCGFFNWGYQLRIGIDFTASCQEVCSYAPILYDSATSECGLTCGPVAPTTPAPVVPTVPTPAPVARPPTSDPYDVTLGMDGVPVLDRSRFRAAAARWERIVTQGLSDIANADFPDPPRYASCSYPASGFVDDLYICAEYVTRDGEGGVLGFASTGFRRSVDGLPITGTMAFDTADVNRLKTNSDFDFVLTHEIGHLLGIGTLWTTLGVAGSRDQACPYTGARATAEYNAISRCRTIPTEQDGGDGTRCSHFDEECLDRELMSGFVDTGVTNFLSRISIATLEDMGYQVDYSSADPFRASNLGPGCACRRRSLRGNDDDYDEYNKVSGDTASVSTGRKQFNNSTATTRTDRRRRTNTRHHRQLSDEMLQYAIEQGKEYLQAQPSLPDATMEKLKKDSGILYEGDQYVTVWVRDTNDLIFDVQVYRDD